MAPRRSRRKLGDGRRAEGLFSMSARMIRNRLTNVQFASLRSGARVRPAKMWLTYSHTVPGSRSGWVGLVCEIGAGARHGVSPWFLPHGIQSEYAGCKGSLSAVEAAHVCRVDDCNTQEYHAAKAAAGASASCREASHVCLWSSSRVDDVGRSDRGDRGGLRGNGLPR